jgi:CHAT domain-containing protein
VAARLGGEAVVEGRATRAEFLRRAESCRVLHLAAHGDFRADNPLFSGLALEDGWLTTLDIFNVRLPAALVTLSACDTGRNVIGGGDELLGLMRAFLCAGAASVALTFWEVEDASTGQVMAGFYGRLSAGETKAAALRAAQLALRQDAAYAHPYFWAPFFLVGDYGAL